MALTKNSQIDLNGNEMILDADADTSITASTDDQIDFKVGGSDTVHMGLTTYNSSDRIVLTNTSGNASMAIVAGTSGESSIFMADGTSGDASYRGYVQYQHTNDNFNIGTGGAQRLRIDSDGLKFGSDTAAANALDDYEEGTFTPILRFGSTDNATTYDQTGQYTKIGNTVYVTIQFGFPNGVTTSDSGIAQVRNLPFTSISGARHIGPLSPYGMNGFGNRPVCRVGGGSAILYLNDDHAGAFYVASDFATSAEMFMSITYQGA